MNGATPPCTAAKRCGQRDVIEALLEGGAEPRVKNNRGETPLYLAAWVRRQDVVQLLKGALNNDIS